MISLVCLRILNLSCSVRNLMMVLSLPLPFVFNVAVLQLSPGTGMFVTNFFPTSIFPESFCLKSSL